MWRALLLAIACGCSPPACSDADERRLMADVRLVAEDDGPLAEAASRRLIREGRPAIAPLETGLYVHATGPDGRRRIVKTLGAIGDPEALPLLRHLAARDPDPEVREAAERAARALTPPE